MKSSSSRKPSLSASILLESKVVTDAAGATSALLSASLAAGLPFNKIVFAAHNRSAVKEATALAKSLDGVYPADLSVVIAQTEDVGQSVAAGLKDALEGASYDAHVHISDTATVTNDAMHLVAWMLRDSNRYTYPITCFANHRDYGRGQNPQGIPDRPEYLAQCNFLSSPEAFAFCPVWSEFIINSMFFKQLEPKDWVHSLTYGIRSSGYRVVHPVLSRVRIGDSVNLLSYGQHFGDLGVTVEIDDEVAATVDDWMFAELARVLSLPPKDQLRT